MVKEHSTLVKHAAALVDVLLLLGSFGLAYHLTTLTVSLQHFSDYWVMFLGFLVFYLYFAWTRSLFSVQRFNTIKRLEMRVPAIFLSAAVLGAAILYLISESHSSRRLYLTFVILSCLIVWVEKWLLAHVMAQLRRRGHGVSPVLLFGRGRDLSRLAREIELNPGWGLRLSEKLDASVGLDDFEQTLRNTYVEEVLFCMPRGITTAGYTIDPYLRVCEQMGRPARVFVNLGDAVRFARWEYHAFVGQPTMVSHTVGLDADQVLIKRLFDVAGGVIGCMVLALVTPVAAVLIKLSSRGPLLCRRELVGQRARRFTSYRFRCTRRCGSGDTPFEGEPLTWGGAVVRAMRWEGLPRFVNVLRGEMSLVGTRPCTPAQLPLEKVWHHRRGSFKPGLTGLWRFQDRLPRTIDDIVRGDLAYIHSWSVWLDITLIARTLFRLGTRRVPRCARMGRGAEGEGLPC